MKNNKASKLTQKDYEFMNSLADAMLQSSPKKTRMVIVLWAVAIVAFLAWAAFAEIDEIVRGSGEVIPRGDNKVVQNLEGGIVEEILIQEGERVKKGDLLLKIDNQKSFSSYESNQVAINALKAKIMRLRAEARNEKFVVGEETRKRMPQLIKNEMSLYESDMQRLHAAVEIVKQQRFQKEREYEESLKRLEILKEDMKLIDEEIAIMKPLVEKGIKSQYDFLKLQREKNAIKKELKSIELSLPRLRSAIKEAKTKVDETVYQFQTRAKEQLNEALAKYKSLRATDEALSDQVKRTIVRSPIDGTVQKLYVHTVGGVVKPGADLVEIVPANDSLLIEVKVKPSDIAFIYKGQKAKVKFSAYDFAIYGALDGKVESISPDSIQDEKGTTYFKVRIVTDKNFLQRDGKRLKIIPGMTVSVDIITGKKTILDYILKPILKTKQYSFSEH